MLLDILGTTTHKDMPVHPDGLGFIVKYDRQHPNLLHITDNCGLCSSVHVHAEPPPPPAAAAAAARCC
jgi:hypothetical protein